MVVLDTHVWVWWVHGDEHLPGHYSDAIDSHGQDGIGVSAISCWEVAKLVQLGRLVLPVTLESWMNAALNYPGVRLLDLTPQIAIESTQLPGEFHRDPADQIIVATARVHGVALATLDDKIRSYAGVRVL